MSLARTIFGAPPAQAPQHGIAGFLDRVFNPTNALGQFGQALVATGGDPSRATQLMMQQRAASQQPDAEFAEFQRKYDYELAHPKPHEPTGFAGELQAAGIDPSSPQGQQMLLKKANNTLDPWVNISVPDLGTYYGPVSGMPGALSGVSGGAPASAAPPGVLGGSLPQIGTVLDDPRKGGAGSNASGNFRGF